MNHIYINFFKSKNQTKTRFLYNRFSTNIHLAKILEIMGFFFQGNASHLQKEEKLHQTNGITWKRKARFKLI
jgi:hypothetical protein